MEMTLQEVVALANKLAVQAAGVLRDHGVLVDDRQFKVMRDEIYNTLMDARSP